MPKLTASASGETAKVGTMAASMLLPTSSTTGVQTNIGVMAASMLIPALSDWTGERAAGAEVTGQLASTMLLPTASFTGAAENIGVLSASVPLPTSTVVGAQTNTGVLAASMPVPTASFSDGEQDAWSRTFEATQTGVHLVVLPFAAGVWDADPLTASYAVPYKFHPDGTVSRVKVYINVTSTGTQTITPDAEPEIIHTLQPRADLIIEQTNDTHWVFSLDENEDGWDELNLGLIATRVWSGRPVNPASGNNCDFGVRVWLTYYAGALVSTEIVLYASLPQVEIQRNYPLLSLTWGGVPILADVMTDLAATNGTKVGDLFAIPYRDDTLIYAICNEWAGHGVGPFGVDYTLVSGGTSARLISDLAKHEADEWYASWGHPPASGSSGDAHDFGVCHIDAAAAFNDNDSDALRALHSLCSDWLTRPQHILKADGSIGQPRENHDQTWVTVMAEDRGKCYTAGTLPRCPHGKVAWESFFKQGGERPFQHGGIVPNSNPPRRDPKLADNGSHMTTNAIQAMLEFAPTDLYQEEFEFRGEALMHFTGHEIEFGTATLGGEERAYARVGTEMLACVPYMNATLKALLLTRINQRQKLMLANYKTGFDGTPNRSFRASSGLWPGHTVFLPWQDGLLLAHIWAAHISGHSELVLTADELNTLDLTIKWLAANAWRLQGGNWQCGYYLDVNLSASESDNQWSNSIGTQGVEAFQAIVGDATGDAILAWFDANVAETDRWIAQRPA